jgi:glycosyltransferase involved in cell wall biosynthesis
VPRVLILSWEYPPIVEGGLARHVRKLAEGLVWAGAEVHVLARGGGRLAAIEDRHGVTVHRVREPEFPTDDLDAFVRWVDAMNDDMRAAGAALGDTLSFDLVHSHDWLVAGAARRLARRFGCPWLVTVHPTEARPPPGLDTQAPAAPHPRRRAADGARRRPRDHLLALHARPRRRGVRDRRRRITVVPTASIPATSSPSPTCRSCGRATRRPASGSCCWSGGSSTRRASTSRSTRSRA